MDRKNLFFPFKFQRKFIITKPELETQEDQIFSKRNSAFRIPKVPNANANANAENQKFQTQTQTQTQKTKISKRERKRTPNFVKKSTAKHNFPKFSKYHFFLIIKISSLRFLNG